MNLDKANIFNNPYALSFNKAANQFQRKQSNTPNSNQNRQNSNPTKYQPPIQRGFKNNTQRPQSRHNIYQKSRLSNRSEDSYNKNNNIGMLVNEADMFPQDLIFLLSDEEKNITSFKQRIQKQKLKLQNDFTNFKNQIQHIVEDLKISLHAQLDSVYKTFIQKYSILKTEVQQCRKIKKQVEANYHNQYNSNYGNQNSNKELVKELQRQTQNYKKFRINNYIAELQKKKMIPVLELSKQIIQMGTTNNPYYIADTTLKQLLQLKSNFSHFTKHMFSALGQYIKSPNQLFQQNNILDDLQSEAHKSEYFKKQDDYLFIPNNKYHKNNLGRQILQTPKYNVGYQSPRNINHLSHQPQIFSLRPQKKVNISQSQQILYADSIQDITIKPFLNLRSDHSNIILCTIIIDGKYIATGSKDTFINIYTFEGYKVTTLKGHDASICTLSIIQDQSIISLASGSDVGCSSIIIWDINSWSIKSKIQAHTAAVTSILDLGDGQTLISGSYDKKINVYNYKKSLLMYNLANNKSSVTGIIINGNRTKLLSCGLDNTLYVWNIIRKNDGRTVQNIIFQRIIQNNSMICALNSSILRNDIAIAGTKDGKIKFFNIMTGQIQKTLTANNNAIIQLVVIQRQSKPNFPIILSCSSKDKTLVMTRTDTGINSLFDVNQKLNIEFGCGIGPKIIFERLKGVSVMAIVGQTAQRKEVNIFQLQLKI